MNRLRCLPLANMARLCGLLTLLCTGTFFFGVRWVDAQLNELLHGLGAELMAYPASPTERPRAVYVNGARFFLRTTTVKAAVDEVLDYYEALCDRRDAGLSAQLSELAEPPTTIEGSALSRQTVEGSAPSRQTAEGSAPSRQTVEGSAPSRQTVEGSSLSRRTSGAASGHVSCLDLGESPLDRSSLTDRLLSFAKTGNSAQIGALRYAYARPMDEDPSQSFVLTMWTEGSVNLFEVLPTNGADVPGRDPEGVPRPPGVQRILSAWEGDEPYGLTLYSTSRAPKDSLESFYRREFSKRGWKLLRSATDKPLVVSGTRVLGFERDGQIITVLLSGTAGGAQTATVLSTDFL